VNVNRLHPLSDEAQPLKILHVIPSLALQLGGSSVVVAELADALMGLGMQVKVVTTDALTPASSTIARGGAAPADMPDGAERLDLELHSLRHPYRLTFSPSLWRALMDQARQYELLHIHSLNLFPQFAAWRAAARHQLPYVVSPHGALDPWFRARGSVRKGLINVLWQRRMLDGAAALHLTSKDERRLIEPLRIRAPHVVIPNGFDVARFAHPTDSMAFRRRWLAGYAGPLVVNHGRLSEKKGLDILVEAIARLDGGPRLAVIGADDEGVGKLLRQQALQLGIGERVTLVPKLSGTDLHGAIAAADVWALPSHTENFGMAVVEAMAAGRPVVTSPHVNIAPDAAAASALVMVPNAAEELAIAIGGLLADAGHRERLGRTARAYVWRFDWSNVGAEYVTLYQSIIDQHRAGSVATARRNQ
jgi:glycosyltransferase involved in cell wall biosynthesis